MPKSCSSNILEMGTLAKPRGPPSPPPPRPCSYPARTHPNLCPMGKRKYLCTVALAGQLHTLLLHKPEHVEEAVVPGGGQALREAQVLDEVWRHLHNLCGWNTTQPLDQESRKPLQTPISSPQNPPLDQGWLPEAIEGLTISNDSCLLHLCQSTPQWNRKHDRLRADMFFLKLFFI